VRKIRIIASEPLFNKWKEISNRVRQVGYLMDNSCAALMQNDMEVELDSLIKWKKEVIPGLLEELDKRKEEINKLVEITSSYIKRTQ
jgi:hypothetical protein